MIIGESFGMYDFMSEFDPVSMNYKGEHSGYVRKVFV